MVRSQLLKDERVRQEIERYKWIESEKTGVDIGFDRAAEEWLGRFSGEWMKHHPAPASKFYGDLRRFLLFFAGALVCLYLVFSVAISVPYVTHDSVRHFGKFFNTSSSASTYILRAWSYGLGRPVGAEIETFVFKHINHLSDLSTVRAVVLFVLALNAAWLASFAVSWGFAVIPAFCLSVAFFTLPGMQESVFVPALLQAVAILFAFTAYAVWSSRWVFAARLIVAMAFLELAFLTYPSMAFAFLIPTMFIVIREGDGFAALKVCVRDMALCVAGALAYYFIVKMFFYKGDQVTAGYQVVFSLHHIWTRTVELLTQAVPLIFNYWNIYYSHAFGSVLAVFVASVLAAHCFLDRKSGAVQRALAILGIFVTINMIWFISKLSFLPRTFAVSEAVCLLLLYWAAIWAGKRCGLGLEKLASILAATFLMIGLVSANLTVIQNVWNVNSELMFIRSRLVPYINSSTREVRVIQLKDSSKGYHGFRAVSDQFNVPMMTFDYEVPDFLRSALKDIFDPASMSCNIAVLKYGEPIPASDSRTIVVDMNDLVDIAGWGR